jgi:hypothetical protein
VSPFLSYGFFTFSGLITKKNVLHYSHKVHFSVLLGSQNKQRLSRYCVNWLVFITERRSVYCAVRTEISNMTANFLLRNRSISQTLSRLSLISDVLVRSQGAVTGLSPRISVFSRQCSIFIFNYMLLFL